MSYRSLRRSRRKIGAAVLSATLGLAGLGLAAPPAGATPDFDLERLAGTDRIETAVEISEGTFESSADALLARADLYPDALAGNYLAGAVGAPILLSHTDEVPQETLDELERLGVETVHLLGGTAALSTDVEAQLEAAGFTVNRVAGEDRYETAREVAITQDAAGIGETDEGRTALLATGQNFADALTGGPLAYAGSHPLLLTPSNTLSDDAGATLEQLGIEHVLILGGTVAISQGVEDAVEDLGMTTERLAGGTRYSTATEIAEFALTQGFSDEHADVATGRTFPDALTGGPHAGENLSPILLANEGNTTEACAYLTDHSDTVAEGHVFGGTAAVSTAAEETLEACGRGEAAGSNQSFAATPAEPAINVNSTTTGPDANRGARTYTVDTGDATAVDIVLVPSNLVTVDGNGVVTFSDVDTDQNRADLGTAGTNPGQVAAVIESVNGVPVTANRYQNSIAPSGGQVTFTVDSTAVNQSVIPVIFTDADNNNQLNLDADNQPTDAEPFGIGGLKLWTPPVAAFGTYNTDGVILAVQPLDFFTSSARRYNYDSNDVFRYASRNGDPQITLSQEQFETYLSGISGRTPQLGLGQVVPGDTITVNYNPDGSSTFTINDDVPLAPTGVTATVANTDLNSPGGDALNDDVRVTWTAPVNPDVAYYCVYRASVNTTTGVAGTYSQLDADPAVGGTQCVVGKANTEFADRNAAPATGSLQYRYIVVAFNDSNMPGPNSAPADVTINAAAGTATPVSVATLVREETGEAGVTEINVLEEGDAIEITFDSPITVAEGAAITLRDEDGTHVRLTDNTNAQFTVGGANNNVLTIDVTGNPTLVELGGGSPNLELGGQIAVVTSSTGITNANGAWNLPASGCDDECAVAGVRVVSETGYGGGQVTVADFANDELPEAVPSAGPLDDIQANPEADQITLVDNPGGDIEQGDDFFVYNARGVQVATGSFTGGDADSDPQTVNVTGGFAAGDVLYFVYIDEDGDASGNSAPGMPSETTQIWNPSDIPTVTNVQAAEELPADLIRVTWSDDDCPDATNVGITQVGAASNYQVYDAGNNVLVATGEAVTGSPTGGACGPLTVDLNANLQAGVQYVLRIAANTVQDPNNTPNVAEFERFTLFANPPVVSAVQVGGAPVAENGTATTNDTTPTITGTATDNAPIDDVQIWVFNWDTFSYVHIGESTTPTDGAFDENTEGFTFTTDTLAEGSYGVWIEVDDDEGSTESYYFDLEIQGAAAPTITSAAFLDNNTIRVTYSEPVVCDSGANTAFTFDDTTTLNDDDGASTTIVDGANFCDVNFAGTFEADEAGSLVYTQPVGVNDRIEDETGTDAAGQTVGVTDTVAPTVTDVQNTSGTNTVVITFSEPVRGTATPDDFTVTDITNGVTYVVGAEDLDGTASNTATLTLAANTAAAGTLRVTITPESGDVEDVTGNDLVNPTTFDETGAVD